MKKEVFEWIINEHKSIELRRGKAKKGDVAVFQCAHAKLSFLFSIFVGYFKFDSIVLYFNHASERQ